MKIIDGLRKYDDEDLKVAAQLLNRMDWDVKFATELLIYAEATMELLGLKVSGPVEGRSVAPTVIEPAQHGVEQTDAQWFYDKGMSDVGTEQISG